MNNYAKEFARSGGNATKAKYGKEHFKNLQKKSVEKRNAQKIKVGDEVDLLKEHLTITGIKKVKNKTLIFTPNETFIRKGLDNKSQV